MREREKLREREIEREREREISLLACLYILIRNTTVETEEGLIYVGEQMFRAPGF